MKTGVPIDQIHRVATGLGSLLPEVAFVGGAVVGLYVDDPGAGAVRPTKDVDIAIEVLSAGALENLRVTLSEKGFKQSPQDQVICRFRMEGILVDVLSTKAVGWAPSNRWFAPGFTALKQVSIKDVSINVLPLPYFLATKLEAYEDRGGKDPRMSHDLEDVVYLLDNCQNWHSEILSLDDTKLYNFLCKHLKAMLHNPPIKEAVIGHIAYSGGQARFQSIADKIKSVLEGG